MTVNHHFITEPQANRKERQALIHKKCLQKIYHHRERRNLLSGADCIR